MAQKTRAFQVIVEQDETGLFVVECPALPACYTQDSTYEEAMKNIQDVIAMCLEDLKAARKPIPAQTEIIGVRRIEVSV